MAAPAPKQQRAARTMTTLPPPRAGNAASNSRYLAIKTAMPRRSISFLAEPFPSGSDDDDELALHSGGSRTRPAVARIETESDAIALFQRINTQLSAWTLALEPDSSAKGAPGAKTFVDMLQAEVTLDKAKYTYRYDSGRVYEARCLYETYLRQLRFAEGEGLILLPDERGASAEVVLPLLRAYTRSFVPDVARSFGLYADLVASTSFGRSNAGQAAEGEIFSLLIGLCIRSSLFRRALRLVRDMTIVGRRQPSADIPATTSSRSRHVKDDEPSRSKPFTLTLSRKARVDVLSIFMRSAATHAEAYAIYWRLRRMWTGVQADTLKQRLHLDGNLAPQQERGGLLDWMRRITSRSHEFDYLGEGVDPYGELDTSRDALDYWRLAVPTDFDGHLPPDESIHLTEDELMSDDAHADHFQSSRFSLSSILHRLKARPSPRDALATIYALPEERMAQLGASAFSPGGWMHILSIFPDLPCGWVQVQFQAAGSTGGRRKASRSASGEVQQIWIPAPSELIISIFWDMLQAGVSPPPQVYTDLLHYYTRLVKASRQASGLDTAPHDGTSTSASEEEERERVIVYIQDQQRRHVASEAIASLHKLIYLDINLSPDLPLINALMNAYGHLGQIDEVLQIWQTLVNLSGGAKSSPVPQESSSSSSLAAREAHTTVINRMDAQSVAIVIDACGFANSPTALARARKAVAWVRHRDRLAEAMALASSPDNQAHAYLPPPAPQFLMSKGAWDAWLECLCRRGAVREAFRVFTEEMVPILQAQRENFDFTTAEEADGHVPDSKTVGMLLRFAARDRARAQAQGPRSPATRRQTRSNGNGSPGRDADALGGIANSLFGTAPENSKQEQVVNARTAASSPASHSDVFTELRGWVRREMPHLWEGICGHICDGGARDPHRGGSLNGMEPWTENGKGRHLEILATACADM
ncbi:hypothetical protein V8E36_002737 [Tilletia maclaganii]